tara:strand:+ start:60 stop:410 length:351 start_codon:yes stop_codon:yes gene_type:complete
MKKIFKNLLIGSLLTGATALGGLGVFNSQRSYAANGILENEKHVLIASIGYMGGKPSGLLWWRYNQEEPNTVILSFNDLDSCEQAKKTLSENYRESVFNGACIVMPASGEIMQSKS